MAITANIWQGDDYVPHVWDQWFWRDPGLLAVAERGGRLVGQGSLLDMGWGEWWLRGLRVDPEHQGEGIGAHLHEYFVDQWLRTGGDIVRLATHTHRIAVHRMCDQTGFSRVATFVLAVADPDRDGDPSDLGPVDSIAADEVSDRLRRSALAASFSGLMDLGWRFAEIRAQRMESETTVRMLRHGPSDSLLLIRPSGQDGRELQLLALESGVGDLVAILTSVRRWAAANDFEGVSWLTPTDGPFADLAESAGYRIEQEDTLHIYERRR